MIDSMDLRDVNLVPPVDSIDEFEDLRIPLCKIVAKTLLHNLIPVLLAHARVRCMSLSKHRIIAVGNPLNSGQLMQVVPIGCAEATV